MARPKKETDGVISAEAENDVIADAPLEVVPSNAPEAAPVAPDKTQKIKFTAFKVFTSRGRRLQGDIDDFPSDEAAKLIADGNAVAWE